MADPSLYLTYPSPLQGYEGLPPLSNDKSEDGKSYVNSQTGELSQAYNKFVDPIANDSRAGFDVHVYYFQSNPEQTKFAHALWERIRREFPELRIYRVWDRPIGPHPVAMFEVNLFTPSQFGAFVPWLLINRGPLSALVHPNTDDEEGDHSQRATWLGEKFPLDLNLFQAMKTRREIQ
ncbi:hypothetical protein MMC20_005611 [Loxospora ochrophaea]|nr:hypothetical protein [Loxospora ochrophaea]